MTTAARDAPKVGVAVIRDAIIQTVGSTNDRRMTFIASDETVDRYGDVIRANGWDLSNFRQNPVLLFGHQSRALPVGKVPNITVNGTRLIADAEFMPEGMSDAADQVWRAVDGGFLKAASVGFMPTVEPNMIWAADDPNHQDWPTGYEYVGQELLELSVVPVPANPQALALARSLGISPAMQRLMIEPDEGASARVAAQQRRNVLTIARLRPGFSLRKHNVTS